MSSSFQTLTQPSVISWYLPISTHLLPAFISGLIGYPIRRNTKAFVFKSDVYPWPVTNVDLRLLEAIDDIKVRGHASACALSTTHTDSSRHPSPQHNPAAHIIHEPTQRTRSSLSKALVDPTSPHYHHHHQASLPAQAVNVISVSSATTA